MTKHDFWYGREVEGRFTDLQTVFIRGKFPEDYKKYPHVFFTEEAPINLLKEKEYDLIRELLNEGKMVTIEIVEENVKLLPQDIYNRCHLMYRIKAPLGLKMKNTDTICLDMEKFRVLCATKLNMQETFVHTYINDSVKPII